MKEVNTHAGKPAQKKSQWYFIWKRFRRNKLSMAALVVVILLVLSAVFADVIAPYDYAEQDYSSIQSFPSRQHWMGTDNYGRDLLSRVLKGGQVSLLVAFVAVTTATLIGGFFGASAAYFSGTYESVVMRLIDVVMAIPNLLMAICVSAALGTGVINTAIAIAIGNIPPLARIMRASVIAEKDSEYVEAARSEGAGNLRIIFRHIVPNTLASMLVQITLRIGISILIISSLSFIGLGVQPPTPEWGSMLADGRKYIRDFWPMLIFPGSMIVLTIISFNMLGDGLRDALDPRLKQ